MPNKPVPNAKDVLPRGLLRKLQRHCSDLVYIPAPQTQAQMNAARVRSLHIKGYTPAEIAQSVGLTTKHVRSILKRVESGGSLKSRVEHKVYETVPAEVVELVQRYVCGPLYVPPKASQAARSRAIVRRLLQKDVPVAEIAEQVGLSERRVWQIRKAELEAARLKSSPVKIEKRAAKVSFAVTLTEEPEEAPPVLCSSCGSPMDQDGRICMVCELHAKRRALNDDDIIVISHIPLAFIDRKF